MTSVTVFGASYSVYVRIVRLALEEKGVPYRQEEIDIFAAEGPPAGYAAHHPFGKIPAFEHDGFRLYETTAITRYIDAAFPGPALMPAPATGSLRACARVNQILSILDNYAYRAWVWDIYVERVRVPERDGVPDETRIAGALPRAARCLDAIAALAESDPFLAGADLSLADLHAAPMIALFRKAPEGTALLAERPRWEAWWDRMQARPSIAATEPP